MAADSGSNSDGREFAVGALADQLPLQRRRLILTPGPTPSWAGVRRGMLKDKPKISRLIHLMHLMGKHLIGVYLMGMHLTGVHLTGVHLMGVHLMGVHLTGVHLTGVHLSGVHLTGVHLTGVHLTGVHLMGVCVS